MFLIPFAVARNVPVGRNLFEIMVEQRYGQTRNTGPTYEHQVSDWLLKSMAGRKNDAAKELLQENENRKNRKWRNNQKGRLNFFLKHHRQ